MRRDAAQGPLPGRQTRTVTWGYSKVAAACNYTITDQSEYRQHLELSIGCPIIL